MGRRGPAPLPTALKVLRGTARPGRINRHEPEPSPNAPALPDDISDEARVVWERVLREFGHSGVIRAADTDILRLYCEAVARYDYAARLLTETGPLIRGARGGELVKNPLHQIVRDNATLVRALAGDLGLTPSARTSLRYGDAAGTPRHSALGELMARHLATGVGRP